MRLRTLTLLMAAFLLFVRHTGAAPASAPVKNVPPAKPTLLRGDPLLQQKVTLEATDRPLGDVLKDLSLTLKVDLTASSQIADQRVTLRLTDQPVYLLMNRLPQLLSHAPGKPRGYYWERLARPAKARPAFNLWRDLRSVQDEEHERDYPRREAARMLRDMRDVIPLNFQERQKFKSDYPPARYPSGPPGTVSPLELALQGLSDAQIEALVDGQRMPLDPARFAGAVADGKKQQRDQWKRDQEVAALDGRPDPFPHGFPEQPDVPLVLSVRRADEDDDTFKPTQYRTRMEGVEEGAGVIDVYDTNTDRDPNMVPLLAAGLKEPVFDLTPLPRDKSVTPAQRGDVGFALQALAKAAHVNVYQEDFFKEGATAKYDTPGPTPLKGTLPQLIAAVCREWNLHAEKAGDDYLLWSRTWALDRAADIPDRLLAPWRARFQKQGGLTLADDVEIASALTWPQVNLTLNLVLPASGPWDQKKEYNALRLIGLLSSAECSAASSADGLPLAGLSPTGQNALMTCFPQEILRVPSDLLNQAVLRVETPPEGMADRVVGVKVRANGETLFGTILITSPPPAAPSPAAPSPPHP